MQSDNYSQLTNFSIINSLRTGNMILDIIIAFIIPIILNALMSQTGNIYERIKSWILDCSDSEYFYRTIKYTETYDRYGESYTERDDNTDDLMKAIDLYINDTFPSTYQKGDYKYIDLVSPCDSEESCIFEEEEYRNDGRLQRISDSIIMTYPEKNEWIFLTDTLMYRRNSTEKISESTDEKNSGQKTTNHKIQNSVELCSNAKTGAKEEVDAFVQAAIDWFVDDIKAKYKKHRYMYMLQNNSSSSNRENGMGFKKYVLSDYKTFSTIFIPNKEKILGVIDRFQKQEGKFSIAGFPKQLCIMLTGPPGTGKTSLTKAISHYTGRHLIDIPLAKIKTNQDLYELMFDNHYQSQNGTDKHSFKRTLFLMEDIDCVSDIVYKRKKEETEDDIIIKTDSENAETSDIDDINTKDISSNIQYLKALKKIKGIDQMDFKYGLSEDRLNLSGLLNVIDGVIDCPQRMLIITTNHPEKLDPALTRPGRINMQLHLDYVVYQQTLDMISHYIADFTMAQKIKLQNIFQHEPKITPAALEKLCIAYDNVGDILSEIENSLTEETKKESENL